MSVKVIGNVTHSGEKNFPVFIDTDGLVSFCIVADNTARDAIATYRRKQGLHCYVISGDNTYTLGADLTTWTLKDSSSFILSSEKGAANGVAPLNANGKIDGSYLQSLFINAVISVADIPAMLAVSSVAGNMFVVTDSSGDPPNTGSKVYYKQNNDDPAAIDDFALLDFGASVLTVNGEAGTVTISIDSLLSVPANVTSFNTQVAASDYASTNNAAISTIQSDILAVQGDIANLPVSFIELNDTPLNYTGQGGKIVAVKVTEDGLEFGEALDAVTPSDIYQDFSVDPDDANLVAGADAVYDIKQVADSAIQPGDNISELTNDSGFTTYNSSDFDADLAGKTTDDLTEGITNKYLTGNEFQKNSDDLDDITEGTTNKHFTATEKTKLSGIAENANNYTHPNHSGDVTSTGDGATVIANDAVTNSKLANMVTKTYKGRTSSGTGDPEDVSVAALKTDLSLNNVDNTSDIDKPVSTSQQTALNLKANVESPTFTGTVTTPAIIVSSETASTIASFDASKNIKSLDTATYPSLTELTYVKGVTSGIQSQIDSKQSTISFGTGVQTALGVNIGSAGAPILFNDAGGTPSSITLTNATGLPISTGVSGLGSGIATWLATPSWTNFNSAITGTAPYWNLSSGGTLTGANTIAMASNNVNFLNGNVLIAPTGGTITASTRLDIRGVSGGSILRLATEANTTVLIVSNTGISTFSNSVIVSGSNNANTVSGNITSANAYHFNSIGNFNGSTGNFGGFVVNNNSASAGGTAISFYNSAGFTSAVNHTGFYHNPTNPSNISGTHLAFHNTSGSILFGHTTLGASTTRLQVRGVGTTTGLLFHGEDSAGTHRFGITDAGNIYGTSGTTNMTNGFFYIPSAAGVPSGTPTTIAGRLPMYYDSTNNDFYIFNSTWKKVTLT